VARPKTQSNEQRKEKARVRAREWRVNNPERAKLNGKKAHYRTKYGLTLSQVEQLHASATGCEICGSSDKRLVIDHDHESGRVRGLLCDRCNYYVLADRKIEFFEQVIAYLKRSAIST
jgi:hypothetical protein